MCMYICMYIYVCMCVCVCACVGVCEKNANHMAYEGFPHICPMWHNHMWGDPHSTNSLSTCDCTTYANMRETLICHMTPIYLIYIYIYIYVLLGLCGGRKGEVGDEIDIYIEVFVGCCKFSHTEKSKGNSGEFFLNFQS